MGFLFSFLLELAGFEPRIDLGLMNLDLSCGLTRGGFGEPIKRRWSALR
jgi:hypothetical protein